jgi:hypothetical protein
VRSRPETPSPHVIAARGASGAKVQPQDARLRMRPLQMPGLGALFARKGDPILGATRVEAGSLASGRAVKNAKSFCSQKYYLALPTNFSTSDISLGMAAERFSGAPLVISMVSSTR